MQKENWTSAAPSKSSFISLSESTSTNYQARIELLQYKNSLDLKTSLQEHTQAQEHSTTRNAVMASVLAVPLTFSLLLVASFSSSLINEESLTDLTPALLARAGVPLDTLFSPEEAAAHLSNEAATTGSASAVLSENIAHEAVAAGEEDLLPVPDLPENRYEVRIYTTVIDGQTYKIPVPQQINQIDEYPTFPPEQELNLKVLQKKQQLAAPSPDGTHTIYGSSPLELLRKVQRLQRR